MVVDRSALGAFLRTRRDRLTPAEAGIAPLPGPRRVPGLRKEELAYLVGLSPDHYSRLEQGRQPTIGADVLDALVRALRLDDVEAAHLRDLAAPTRNARSTWEVEQRADAGLLRVMATLDHAPALLLGRRLEVLAANGLLRAVLGEEVEVGVSFARWLLLGEEARRRILTWPAYASAAVGTLRFELGRHPSDRRLASLIDELCAADADVARWWADQTVTDRTSVAKRIAHPVAGELTFSIEALTTPNDPDQRLVVYTCEPHSATARALPLLASWAAPIGASTGPDPM